MELKLVWEKRCGRGDANQIYLAQVQPAAAAQEISKASTQISARFRLIVDFF